MDPLQQKIHCSKQRDLHN
ncbi:hypothetical protein Ahy_B07g086315 isoform B [Arachis hypogaea]|uniref:Uncharacterized protein n=1 Tax=Arachis hypogaea TaxID=3818 RepID=A0A444Y9N1_ARAHY|nr:hypothetical protein Ahy_B07g086315 isoform B [Arachis hypogaea]